MSFRRHVLVALGVATLVSASFYVDYALSYPEHWNEELIGLNRKDAWSLLGVPDINFIEKGFDGWSRNMVFGAWALVVRYGENSKIVSVERNFSLGSDYLSWDDDYKRQWQKPTLAPRQP